MSRWRRQQRKRARNRRREDAADLEFGAWLEAWGREFRKAVKQFSECCVWAAGEFAKWSARRREQEAQEQCECL